jgi:glutaredoxin
MKEIDVFGAEWCAKTSGIRNFLQSQWLDFNYYDVETDGAAAEKVRSFYNGKLKFPTVKINDDVLKNPSIRELRIVLKLN